MSASGRVDFSGLGARDYAGSPRTAWGALLTEPPAIRDLRAAAGRRISTLGAVAPAKSGIPSRAVDYFALTELGEADLLRSHGIHTVADRSRLALVKNGRGDICVIERASLKPLIRKPNEVKASLEASVSGSLLFYVQADKRELEELRLRHTLEYIALGEGKNFAAREGSRRAGGVPSERAQAKARRNWYSVAEIPTGAGRVIWPKGRGNTHYVSMLPANVVVFDNFYYSVPVEEVRHPLLLAAICNLSFTHLMLECFGRRSGGDGVLHAYIRELDMLPLLSPSSLSDREVEELVAAFEPLLRRPQRAVPDELQEQDRQAFDAVGSKLLFGPDIASGAQATIERVLRDRANERLVKAESGRSVAARSSTRSQFAPDPIAASVLADVGMPPVLGTEMPTIGTVGSVTIAVPEHGTFARVERGASLFDECTVLLDGVPLVDAHTPEHADLLVALLQSDPGLFGEIAMPSEPSDAQTQRDSWMRDVRSWAARIGARVEELLPGSRASAKRLQVLQSVARLSGTMTSAF